MRAAAAQQQQQESLSPGASALGWQHGASCLVVVVVVGRPVVPAAKRLPPTSAASRQLQAMLVLLCVPARMLHHPVEPAALAHQAPAQSLEVLGEVVQQQLQLAPAYLPALTLARSARCAAVSLRSLLAGRRPCLCPQLRQQRQAPMWPLTSMGSLARRQRALQVIIAHLAGLLEELETQRQQP